jgi:hypothetical protein
LINAGVRIDREVILHFKELLSRVVVGLTKGDINDGVDDLQLVERGNQWCKYKVALVLPSKFLVQDVASVFEFDAFFGFFLES